MESKIRQAFRYEGGENNIYIRLISKKSHLKAPIVSSIYGPNSVKRFSFFETHAVLELPFNRFV